MKARGKTRGIGEEKEVIQEKKKNKNEREKKKHVNQAVQEKPGQVRKS